MKKFGLFSILIFLLSIISVISSTNILASNTISNPKSKTEITTDSAPKESTDAGPIDDLNDPIKDLLIKSDCIVFGTIIFTDH